MKFVLLLTWQGACCALLSCYSRANINSLPITINCCSLRVEFTPRVADVVKICGFYSYRGTK